MAIKDATLVAGELRQQGFEVELLTDVTGAQLREALHASVPAEIRAEIGISDSLVRLSVGIEDADDLIADLDTALA